MASHPGFDLIAVFVTLIVCLFLPHRFWKKRRMNHSWRIFEEWSKRKKFRLDERNPRWNNPDAPSTSGRLHGIEIEIVTLAIHHRSRALWSPTYRTAIRAHSKKHKNLSFEIVTDSMLDDLVKKVGLQRVVTGNHSFDDTFRIKTNDEDLVLHMLDQHTTDNLVANAKLFSGYGLKFQNGYLRYEAAGLIKTEEIMDAYGEIAEFMATMVARLDSR